MNPRFLTLSLQLLSVASLAGQSVDLVERKRIPALLGFEEDEKTGLVANWPTQPPNIFLDDKMAYAGKRSARIERGNKESGRASGFGLSIPKDFRGSRLDWCGYLRAEDVSGYVSLWMGEESASALVGLATMEGQKIEGTFDWKRYCVHLPVEPTAQKVSFGALLSGGGKFWVDSLELLVDGKPVALAAEAPLAPAKPPSEFEKGSRVSISTLSDLQIRNLALTAKVWGFLKYHHTAVTAGKVDWDAELLRVMPSLLAAEDVRPLLADWAEKLGPPAPCSSCASLKPEGLQLAPDLAWIEDTAVLGDRLQEYVREVYKMRPGGQQHYVKVPSPVGNPRFENELDYASAPFPDAGLQLLGLFRFWNMMQYFNPNREIMGDDPKRASSYWHEVLRESIRPFALAKDKLSYEQEFFRLIAKVHDGHSNLWSSIGSLPPVGECALPFALRFVEGKALVLGWNAKPSATALAVERGDVLETLDGVSVSQLAERYRSYYPVSNESAYYRDLARFLTRGACGAAKVGISRVRETIEKELERVPIHSLDLMAKTERHREGPTFQRLSQDVAYLKLTPVKAADARTYVERAAGTKGLIIDIRNYPAEFMVFALGGYLVDGVTDFARFTGVDLANPGAFYWRDGDKIRPLSPQYKGKVVILVDDSTQSQAEYTTMAFRQAKGALVIGSQTSGADGNVSPIILPGKLRSMISGIGVYYPDRRPTQRIGIVPDIVVKPTIAGIRAGRDEVLEEAIRQIERLATVQ